MMKGNRAILAFFLRLGSGKSGTMVREEGTRA